MNKQVSTMRNYGIELLRVVSMISIIVLHVLSHGGVLTMVEKGVNFGIVWLVEIIAYPAVCCFMLISGFVGYRCEPYNPKLKKIIFLYIIVLFYSVILTAGMKMVFPEKVSVFDLLISIFPIITKRYWFFTSYFVVFLFSPIINSVVCRSSAKMLSCGIWGIVFLGIVEIVTQAFSLSQGYSFMWLSFLYFIGAVIKKYNLLDKASSLHYVCFIGGAIIISWLIKMIFPTMNINVSGVNLRPGHIFISYCSPTVLIMALGWLGIFYKMQLNKIVTRIVTFLSSSVFSVYLIHDNEVIRRIFIKDKFLFLLEFNPPFIIIGIIFNSLIIFLCCIFIDKLRMILFKCLKINVFSERAAEWITKKYDLFFSKLKRIINYE